MKTMTLKLISARMLLLAAMFLVALTLFPIKAQAAGYPAAFQTLARGDHGQIIAEADMVLLIETPEELSVMYEALGVDERPMNFDIDEVTVIAVVASPRPSSGYSVEVANVYPIEDGSFTIDVLNITPREPCSVLTVETTPYHLVAISGRLVEKTTRVNWLPTTYECQ
ncbi:MAG: protease complex subunit PrcB family protein [Acidobacteria bacterium]|nr:protease complex subunit PrcB family protein [Acidobacteriota bacterium]MBI3655017.1 protease complex subunit PrcB family protein [Acidobacteriota bacterium]